MKSHGTSRDGSVARSRRPSSACALFAAGWLLVASVAPARAAQHAVAPGDRAPAAPAGSRQGAAADPAPARAIGESPALAAAATASSLPFRSVAYATGLQPRTVTAADLNGDGYPDLIVPNNGTNTTTVLYGNADGIYDGAAAPAVTLVDGAPNPQKAVAADFNGDGRLDVAIVHFFDGIFVWYQNPDGSFGTGGWYNAALAVSGSQSPGLAAGDLNGDGIADLAVASYTGSVTVWIAPGAGGTWQPGGSYWTGTYSSVWIALADMNGDGTLDFVTSDDAPYDAVTVALGNPAHAAPYFGATRVFPAGSGPNTCAVGDLNGDGAPDVVTANWNVAPAYGSISVFLGRGDGTLGPASNTSCFTMQQDEPFAVAIGDVTGDSRPDVVVAHGIVGTVGIYAGRGDGTLDAPRLYGVGSAARGIALADANGDGRLDVVVSNLNSNTAEVLTSSAAGALDGAVFPIGTDTPATFSTDDRLLGSLASVDLNGDGHADLATIHPADGTATVVLGRGDGTFGPPVNVSVGSNPQAAILADFDGDGFQDLAAVNRDNGTVSVLPGNGDGTFKARTAYGAGKGPVDVIAADVNDDGLLDVVTANRDESTISVLIKNKGGGFKDRVKYDVPPLPNGLAAADVNGDGRTDVVVACESGYFSALAQLANGKLSAAVNTYAFGPASYVALADFDGDGRLDVAVSSPSQNRVSYWYATTGGFAYQGFFFTDGAPMRLSAGDLDGDGWPEIIAAARLGQTFVLEPGTPAPPRGLRRWAFGSAGTAALVADVNEDGTPDLITLDPRCQGVSVLLNAAGSGAMMASGRMSGVAGGATLADLRVSPNPLNPSASMKFTVGKPGPLRVRLFDVRGRLVRTLLDEAAAEPGERSVSIDGRDDHGSRLASGIYFYRIDAAGSAVRGRIAVLK